MRSNIACSLIQNLVLKKMNDRNIKQYCFGVGTSGSGGGRKERVGISMLKYSIQMLENRTIKPAECVTRRGEGGGRGVIAGMSVIMVHCMQIWKYHNETLFVLLIYANKMGKNLRDCWPD
jgi:hypothetical protein